MSNVPYFAFLDLKRRMLKGGAWLFALRGLDQSLALVGTIVLARLLEPADFGFLAIASLCIGVIQVFFSAGLEQALIRQKKVDDAELDTLWTINVITGGLLFILINGLAWPVTAFFERPDAEAVVRVLSLTMLIDGFANVGTIFFRKEMLFHKQVLLQSVSSGMYLALAVPVAVCLQSVWALVAGALAASFCRLIMSYTLHGYRPRLSFDWEEAKALFRFGRWALGSNILVFLINRGDDILVGKMLGASQLGLYRMAFRISSASTTEITHVISQVAFPAYAKIQESGEELRKLFLGVFRLTVWLSCLAAGLIVVMGPEFIQLALGAKWVAMVEPMIVLALAGFTRSVQAATGPLFYAVGKPRMDTHVQVVRFATMALLIYPFTLHWGLLGTSTVVLISILASSIVFIRGLSKVLAVTFHDFVSVVLPPVLGVVTVGMLLWVWKNRIVDFGAVELVLLPAAGTLGYSLVFFLTRLLEKHSRSRPSIARCTAQNAPAGE